MGGRNGGGNIEERRDRVAHQVQRYFEHLLARYERGGFDRETPINRKAKGETNPPMPESAIALMDANRPVANLIRPHLERIERSGLAFGGVEFRGLILEIRYDPGAPTKWRTAETEADEKKVVAFWKMCQFIADLILQGDPFADDGFWVETSVAKAMASPTGEAREALAVNG
jgi:hypothetical protein